MKALRFHKFGSPSVLSIENIPKPEPGPGETLVQVRAAAINPSDVKNVAGFFPLTTLPRTPGRDFSGIIAGGEGKLGEEVWSSAPGYGMARDGVHAEYIVVPPEILYRKPANLSMEQAAAIGVPFITAWSALIRAAQLETGETILIIGAAGAVGQAAVQIANWKGAHVIGADYKPDRVIGAEAVVVTSNDDLRERVYELTNGKGADVVFDTVGGLMFEKALQSLRVGGRQIAITSTGNQRVSFNLVDFYHNLHKLIGVDTNKLSLQDTADIVNKLGPGFESGHLKPVSIEVVPFEKAVEAYEKVAARKSAVKQVLSIS
jgi:NADPH:quinone reductase-like Zn-dependent oxidoreductase